MNTEYLHVLWFNPDTDCEPRFYDVHHPLIPATSDAINRGVGVFETIGILSGRILNLDEHLERMCTSANRLGLRSIEPDRWRSLILQSAKKIADQERAGLRVVYARNSNRSYVAWIAAFAVRDPDALSKGIKVITLQRGVRSDAGRLYPWLLFGAKTVSYAVNMHALEVAQARGADDAIFLSEDGLVLEGTTSNLIAYNKGAFITPCPRTMSILPGTTQKRLFMLLEAEGKKTLETSVATEALYNSEGVWLTSSVRMITPVVSVDGNRVRFDPGLTDWLNELLARSAV
ncbi:aminodeoxychorismate lyase [Tropheryma whipplei]|uniref:aminodeoxychorismate lyase n=1 Tax=Tropheryma whipplei TaxID=2039 RepID=UPI0004B4D973|nr:aminodeoxychorismate lyase [Tropheryma whipplei]